MCADLFVGCAGEPATRTLEFMTGVLHCGKFGHSRDARCDASVLAGIVCLDLPATLHQCPPIYTPARKSIEFPKEHNPQGRKQTGAMVNITGSHHEYTHIPSPKKTYKSDPPDHHNHHTMHGIPQGRPPSCLGLGPISSWEA